MQNVIKKINCAAGVHQSLGTGDTVSHVVIFDPALWTFAPLTFSLAQISPHPPPSCVKKYASEWGGGGGGYRVLLETIFCRNLTLCFWPDSEPTNLLHHPKQKPRRGGGLRQINTICKVLLKGNCFRCDILLWLISQWTTSTASVADCQGGSRNVSRQNCRSKTFCLESVFNILIGYGSCPRKQMTRYIIKYSKYCSNIEMIKIRITKETSSCTLCTILYIQIDKVLSTTSVQMDVFAMHSLSINNKHGYGIYTVRYVPVCQSARDDSGISYCAYTGSFIIVPVQYGKRYGTYLNTEQVSQFALDPDKKRSGCDNRSPIIFLPCWIRAGVCRHRKYAARYVVQ